MGGPGSINYQITRGSGAKIVQRLLPPRVLHFAQTQLYWECDEVSACESYPKAMPYESGTNVKVKAFNPFTRGSYHSEEATIDENLETFDQRRRNFVAWGWILEQYTGSKLTYEKDKLVAVSAIAKEMKPRMRCRYLAGLWENDMVRQLAWQGSFYPRPTTYRAPSWSWASVDGKNQYFINMYPHGYQYYPLIEILTAHVDLASEDEMGPVTGGYLDVHGRLFRVDAEKREGKQMEKQPEKDQQEEEDHAGEEEWAGWVWHRLNIQGLSTELLLLKDVHTDRLDGPLYCIMLFLSLGGNPRVKGLALEQAGTLNSYRRVGSIEPGSNKDLRRDDP